MPMRLRITESPFLRGNPNEARHQGRWLPNFHPPLQHELRISMHNSQSKTEAETAAFGYRARALAFEQRVRKRTFGYPRYAPSLTASDGLALSSRGGAFRSRPLTARRSCFFGTSGTAQRPPRRAHLTYPLVLERLSGRLCARCCLMARLRHASCIG
jgi:hypothetical protein